MTTERGTLTARMGGYDSVFQQEPMMTFKTNFGRALDNLKNGFAVAREGWNGKGMWLRLQRPDEGSKMTLPYIYIEYPARHPAYPQGSRVPWLASQTDMLAEDWDIVTGVL